VQGIPAEKGHFQSSSFLFGATVERVCASFQHDPHKSTILCGFVYNCVENARCTTVLVSVFTKYRVDYFLCGSIFKNSDI